MNNPIISSIQNSCPSSKNIFLFYTTESSPNDLLLQCTDDQQVTVNKYNAHLSLSVEDHVTYSESEEAKGKKKNCYTYLIELEITKKIIPIINKIQTSTQYIFSHYSELLYNTSISLYQMYFVDSNDRIFQTGLLPLLSNRNIELETVKQFPLDGKLKSKIREFTSNELLNSGKIAVDLQKKSIRQLEFLEKSKNAVFGKKSPKEKDQTGRQPFYFLKVPRREQVQLSLINWFDHFLQSYEKNAEYSIKMLLENRQILLSQICGHIEEARWKEYNDSNHIPSTLPSLEFLFTILQRSYVDNNITKEDILEFLLPVEKNATPTCFIIEKYYYLPVAQSYIYLFSQILTKRSLHPEVFSRIYKCISCKHSSDSATFLRRLKRGIKSAKLDWKFHDDTRGISNLYPLLQTLDACRRNDTISLSQRIAMIFSYNEVPLQKVLETFYKLENRMKRKDFFPLVSEEQILSLEQLEQKLHSQKEMYTKILQECQKKNKEAQENWIKQKQKEIADLEKVIKEVENWEADDDFDPFTIIIGGFCTLFRPEDPESIRRKAYCARQDALREWERWERNQRGNRFYEQAHPLGLFGLLAPSSSGGGPQKESQNSISSMSPSVSSDHRAIPTLEEMTLRLEYLRSDTSAPSLEELTRRHEILKRDRAVSSYDDLKRRLQNLRS